MGSSAARRAPTPRDPVSLGVALVVRLRWLVVAAWLGAAAAAAFLLPGPGEAGGGALGSLVPENAPAVLAQRRSAELFDFPALSNTVVVQRDPAGLTAFEQWRALDRARRIARREYPELLSVPFALPVLNTLGVLPSSREAGTTALTFLFFEPETGLRDRRKLANWLIDVRMDEDRETVAGVTGIVPARVEEGRLIADALPAVELATVVLVALVIGVTFRGLVAPLLTLGAVAIAYVVSRGAVAVAGEFVGAGVPGEVEPVVLVLLLGLVTDYCIFLLSGTRHRLAAGEGRIAAATGAATEHVPIIGTAGLIVAAGAGSLVVARLEFFRVFGPALAVAVLVGLAVSVTLVPALIAILGRSLFWPVRPRAGSERGDGRIVGRMARSRPLAAAVALVTAGGLAVASLGLREAELAVTSLSGLPADSEPARAAAAAAEGFAPGILSPTLLLVEEHTLAGEELALVRLQRALARLPGVAGVIGPGNVPREVPVDAVRSELGTGARYLVVLEDEPLSAAAVDRLAAIREAMPRLLDEVGLPIATVSVGGNTAIAEETIAVVVRDIARIALAALAVNLVLLVLFLRALVAPLLVLAASVLAVTATLGITVVVTQALGWEVTYYVPFMAAVLLVSLGSDYNVFLVGRIWSEARRRPLREAVAVATPAASRAIAAAAIALALSFALLALVPLRSFRELALAMMVGVLVDAFLVRSWLVPALIVLAGRAAAWPGPSFTTSSPVVHQPSPHRGGVRRQAPGR
jgi:putative drug exporter of the RND superfamily